MVRVLGKGITAQAVKENVDDVILYDETDFNLYDKASNDITIVSPGIPPYNPMILEANNLQSDYDFVSDTMPYSIWISGTNGKTTTTQMLQHLLEKFGSVCGGNIGTAVCALNAEAKIWILETSSFTLHYTTKAKPNIYILLPISEDHISWHGSFEAYENAKLKAMDSMGEGEVAIIPFKYKDYPTQATKITYENSDDLIKFFNIEKNRIKFKEPFLMDAVLALCVTKVLFDEFDYDKINAFTIGEHKVEEFFDQQHRLWIDDSKATNIDATLAALQTYENRKIYLLLGGDDKGANLEPLFERLKNIEVEIFAIGKNEAKIIALSEQFNLPVFGCQILENAVKKMSKNHDKNSVAMLSPAAASLDQFTSYKHRGEEFKRLVNSLS
ncbi:MAG: UDP-N-acetylmuramoyl-L-alanine--D-glutamate ligase [Candidatus Marinarcus sp.]|uniref:UDP-N-acetylmuramoyl-L-alanine--D-glutamate ligase n=1 Tax=Candidatus Marinarcus sp. TaxID=3100987 RepID=UPI003B00BBD9